MKLRSNITKSELFNIARSLHMSLHNFEEKKPGIYRFTLRPLKDCQFYRRDRHLIRKIYAVCFHGHVKFFVEVFKLDPNARFYTALAASAGLDTKVVTRESIDEFYDAVGDINIGSMIEPCLYSDACDCDADLIADIYEDMKRVVEGE